MEIHRVITTHNLGSLTDQNFHFSPWSQTKEETNCKHNATFAVIPRTQHNNHMTTLKCIPSKSSTLMDNKSPMNPLGFQWRPDSLRSFPSQTGWIQLFRSFRNSSFLTRSLQGLQSAQTFMGNPRGTHSSPFLLLTFWCSSASFSTWE